MKPTLSASAWRERFLVKLSELLPAMPIKSAIAWSTRTYTDARHLEPEKAAEIFCEAIPPEDVGAPAD